MNVSWGWELEGDGGWIRWFPCQSVFKKGLHLSVSVKNEPQGDSMKMWTIRWYDQQGKVPGKVGENKTQIAEGEKGGVSRGQEEATSSIGTAKDGEQGSGQSKGLGTSGSESEFLSQLSACVSSVIWVWQATARKERKLQQKLRRIARPFESSVETSIQDKTVPWKARLWGFSPTEFSPISVGSRGTRTKGSLVQKAARVMKGHWEGCWEDRWGDRTKRSQWIDLTGLLELASEIIHTTSHS